MDLQSLRLRISRSENLAVLPSVVVEILQLYDGPHVSPRSLEKIIERDAALTAKVLKIAGSSAYGVKSATSVGRAVSVLGFNTLRSIAISLGYQQILSKKEKIRTNFDRECFGKHCLAVAVAAKHIARVLAPPLAEEMYIAGLMHDIGILALDRFCSPTLTVAIKNAQFNRLPLTQAERSLLDFDHFEVGGMLCEVWQLSPMMTNAIRYHENPHGDEKNPLSTAIVIGANFLAHESGFPEVKDVSVHPESELLFRELGLAEDQIEEIKARILAEVEQASSAFGELQAA